MNKVAVTLRFNNQTATGLMSKDDLNDLFNEDIELRGQPTRLNIEMKSQFSFQHQAGKMYNNQKESEQKINVNSKKATQEDNVNTDDETTL